MLITRGFLLCVLIALLPFPAPADVPDGGDVPALADVLGDQDVPALAGNADGEDIPALTNVPDDQGITALADVPDVEDMLPGRRGDFLEIQGSDLALLQGKPLKKLELLAVKADSFEPIPFQVDERVEIKEGKYEWVLPKGPKGGAVKGDGLLGPFDELVFMAKDVGPRAGPELLKALPAGSMEIRVMDPVSSKVGYACLALASGKPRLSETDYVRYDVTRDYIETPVYTVGHSEVFPIAHNENVIKKEAGGEGLDLIDIFKQRILATAFFGTLKFDKRARDWTSEISAYKDGPVRVIRKNENHLYLAGKIKSPSLYTYTFYLRDLFWFPAEVNVPFRLSRLITSMDMFAATDFCRNAVGMEFFSNSEGQGVLVDGITSPQEEALNREVNQTWMLVTGSQGTWMNRILIGPGLEPVHRWLFYEDDVQKIDPPEEEEGVIGKVGYSLGNLENLKGGSYSFRSYIHFPEHFHRGEEKNILNMLDRPLQVSFFINEILPSGSGRRIPALAPKKDQP